jgi:nucleoside-diphosphate kinase
MERTYVMLKPDALKRKIAGEIISRIEHKGYCIKAIKTLNLSPEILREHYAHIADKPFYPALENYMMSGAVIALIVEGENCITGMRVLMGATKFEEAAAGTIRGDYALSTTENVIHGSDSSANAEAEIKRFFGD